MADDIYFIDTAFYSGLDEFKAGFKTNPSTDINTKTTFTGKTLTVAQNGDVRKDLTGSSSLTVDNQTAQGDVNVNNSLDNDDILITDKNIKGSIDGQLFGPTKDNPTEGVGAFDINTGDDVSVKGAFGVKKVIFNYNNRKTYF